jgi:NAD(P)-dependent dehydrogenase (short-subunit alcohol dehydrogenase family)
MSTRFSGNVAAIDRNRAEAELTAKQITRQGGTALPFTADVTCENDVHATVDAVADRLGPPTVLHNSVGATTIGDIWHVANAAVFLASDEAAYISGVCLPVDGGLSVCAR